ncbi:MAG: SDR family oxidoreductase [Bacteroidetes bacterium]|nr:SDR family oxidoreductase [Bacteroidota bacterium]
MYTMKEQTVLITGASSGIGRSCARLFAQAGARLVLVARRKERLDELSSVVQGDFGISTYCATLDVRSNEAVDAFAAALPEAWRNIDVLVNNAGLSRGLDKVHEGSVQDWEEMIDTNVKGLLYVSRAVIPWMVARKKGTIVNIGSIAGHEVYPKGAVYCATKHAVDAITKGMRLDLMDTPIRVCTVDPGLVETEFSEVRFRGDKERAKTIYQGLQPLTPDDIADIVLFAASRPPHVQIAEVIAFPTAQAGAVIVHRT